MSFIQAFAVVEGAVILLGIWIVFWLRDVLAAQRKALDNAQVTLRLYRETRNDSDAQIRALLDQNERLAILLVESRGKEFNPLLVKPLPPAVVDVLHHAGGAS